LDVFILFQAVGQKKKEDIETNREREGKRERFAKRVINKNRTYCRTGSFKGRGGEWATRPTRGLGKKQYNGRDAHRKKRFQGAASLAKKERTLPKTGRGESVREKTIRRKKKWNTRRGVGSWGELRQKVRRRMACHLEKRLPPKK